MNTEHHPIESFATGRPKLPMGASQHEAEEIDYESLPSSYSLQSNMLAGAFAGVMEHSVIYPVDLLKVGLPCFQVCVHAFLEQSS
ncbi:MAG: hypothetical protein INR71_06050 [Terriglobus roseus]|nr:hypothetical protein [Terriglobus roseus]